QAEDGSLLRDVFGVVESSVQDFPPAADLVSRTKALAARLSAGRTAPIGEEYSGPVLLEGEASAELFAHALVPLTLAARPPDADNPRVTTMAQAQVTPFLTKIGSRVLAEGLSIADTPSLARFDNRPVPGAYPVDAEGLAAK